MRHRIKAGKVVNTTEGNASIWSLAKSWKLRAITSEIASELHTLSSVTRWKSSEINVRTNWW